MQATPSETGPRNQTGAPGASKGRKAALYGLVSLVMLLPCYWQPRVQAGDISSHIYNAWLSQLIEAGRAQGLLVVQRTTNILFDLILGGLFNLVGAEAAQRIAVSLAVLTFVWGAFAFITVVSGRRPWHLLPAVVMLAYGWVFHMGFFNFYLSLGLCFWAISLVWAWKRRNAALAAAVLGVAYLAHALPVAWAVCLLGYLWAARHVSGRKRVLLTFAAVVAMALLHAAVQGRLVTQWSLQQMAVTAGSEQAWVFDAKYYVVLAALLTVWALQFLDLVKVSGAWRVAISIPFQFCLISAAGIVVLPTTVLLPGFHHSLLFVAERMSLGVGVCVCALLGKARPGRFQRYALAMVALVFFAFLYRDERALNSFQDRMQNTLASVTGPQVVNSTTPER